ncbi:hypothetical protein [Rhizobium laguerreae]|uniref:Uncharacterized protein n=1 Tax=Rhizobium laguerreae TaxID=1076926 RepID=A0A6N9ZL80_9HYPH|nr:hypothetical protein [Rhizobium laguerreae]NEH93498.1 hypothetical protein [Rhizobium laguerreae]
MSKITLFRFRRNVDIRLYAWADERFPAHLIAADWVPVRGILSVEENRRDIRGRLDAQGYAMIETRVEIVDLPYQVRARDRSIRRAADA